MSDTKKIRKIGGSTAPNSLSVEMLAKFAESIIRSDKEAALRSQQGVADLVTTEKDNITERAVRMSSLEAFCGKAGETRVKVKKMSVEESSDESLNNVVTVEFGSRKKS